MPTKLKILTSFEPYTLYLYMCTEEEVWKEEYKIKMYIVDLYFNTPI